MIRLPHIAFALALNCSFLLAQTAPAANYDEAKVGAYTLPDPLTFKNGKRVRDARDWQKRRDELISIFAEDVYGRSPEPLKARYEVFDTDENALGGRAIRKQITIYFSNKNDGPKADLLVYLPTKATSPVPLFLTLNFSGNHTVTSDGAVRLAMVWNAKTHERTQATEDSRGRDTGFDVPKILARGYGFATMYYQDVEPDFKGGVEYGIRPLFYKHGQIAPAANEWGAIGAWSYGASRALDYLMTEPGVDHSRIALMGHSRLGKAALWAGALDTRFAMVIANCPGEGGASLARRNYGETLRSIEDRYGYWFADNLAKFADDPNRLPVDMHELIALIAPRPVYINGAEEDRWADPKGEFLAEVAAGPVFQLLGAKPIGITEMPPLHHPVMATEGFHYRAGKHAVTDYDWDQFLGFTDMHFQNTKNHGPK